MIKKHWGNAIPPLLLAASLGTLYWATMARHIYLEDSAEFITASLTFSIPHPSGYPLYILLSRLFSVLPLFSSVVERLNFFSSALTVSAVTATYFALVRIFKNKTIALSLSFLFGISPVVWLHATYAEVYALNTLLVSLMLLLYSRYSTRPRAKLLYALAFVFGLGASNHFLILAATPVLVFGILRILPLRTNDAVYVKMLASFCAGLLPYLYIPIRSASDPAFSWFDGNLEKLLAYNIPTGHRFSMHTARYISDVLTAGAESYSWVGIALIVGGTVALFYHKNRHRHAVLWLLLLFSVVMLVLLVGGQEYTPFASWFYQQLYAPFFLFALIPIGYALKLMHNSRFRIWLFYTMLLALLIWPATELGSRYVKNDRSTYTLFDEYTTALLTASSDEYPLFIHSDHIINDPLVFGSAYQHYMRGMHSATPIYSLTPVFLPPNDFPRNKLRDFAGHESKLVIDYRALHKNILTTFPASDADANGFVYGTHVAQLSKPVTLPNLFYYAANDNPYHQSLIAKYYYDQAARLYKLGAFKAGQWFLVQAIAYDPDTFSDYYNRIIAYRDTQPH